MSERGGPTCAGSELRKSYFVRAVMGRHRPVRAADVNGRWDFGVFVGAGRRLRGCRVYSGGVTASYCRYESVRTDLEKTECERVSVEVVHSTPGIFFLGGRGGFRTAPLQEDRRQNL